ncbi:hypothetical protein WME97_42160 [Sorangium sp. So ce367]|uniref:hypothetical protein n=1 Tax=Sorangium sp. So ce367 TaxID=3133305 RepID=UPI003F6432E5
MTLGRFVLVGCLSLVGSALVACGNGDPDGLGEGRGNVVGTPSGSEGDGCTLTQGYWKNHEESWPVSSLTIGGVTYSQEELLDLFATAPGGDKSLILVHQLVAARLNVESGANDEALDGALAEAEAWMADEDNKDADGRLPYGVMGGSAASEAVSLSETLTTFNEGRLGPSHCHHGPGGGSGSTSGDPGDSSSSGDPGGSDDGGHDCPDDGSTGETDGGGGSDPGGSSDPGGGEGGSASTCADPCSDGCTDGYICVAGCCAFIAN